MPGSLMHPLLLARLTKPRPLYVMLITHRVLLITSKVPFLV